MNYEKAIDWLYGTQLFGIKLGLEGISRMLDVSGISDDLAGKKILHVAGTNGKGSVCAFAESILRNAGYKTGLFTSPHLIHFPERIRINGVEAGSQEIAEGLSAIREEVEKWKQHPTFFEITLAVAMKIFCDADCDRIVLETGMGGRFDATNALDANVSVITPISLDHQEWLGNSLEKIAAEKAGIIKEGIPAILSDQEPIVRSVIEKQAKRVSAPLIEAKPIPHDWTLGLRGRHQRENAALAMAAVQHLGNVSKNNIREGLEATEWPGRFQIIGDRLIVDGAHNEAAAKSLVETWRDTFGDGEKANLIFGVASEKDIEGLLGQLKKIASQVTFVPIKSDRRMSVEQMKIALGETGGEGIPTEEFNSLAEALENSSRIKERTLIAGSLFLVGEALSLLEGGRFEVSSQ